MLVVVVLLAFVVDWHCFCSYHRYCYCCCYYGSQLVSLICPSFYKAGNGCGDNYGDKDGDVLVKLMVMIEVMFVMMFVVMVMIVVIFVVMVTRMIRTSGGFFNQYRQ